MKYIVEFEDEPCMYEDEVHYYKCIQAPWWGLSERVIKQLTPYQPDAPDANVGNITNSCGHEKDLISRQAALDAIDSWRRNYLLDLQEPIDDCWNSVRELPAVQPERKQGRWKEHIFEGIMGGRPRALMCNQCNSLSLHATNFCPNCGADMRQKEEGT